MGKIVRRKLFGGLGETFLFALILLSLVFWTGIQACHTTAVQPSAGSDSSAQRSKFNPVHVDLPYVALTFDDGPDPAPRLLDIVAAHHAKATFFVIGKKVAQNP